MPGPSSLVKPWDKAFSMFSDASKRPPLYCVDAEDFCKQKKDCVKALCACNDSVLAATLCLQPRRTSVVQKFQMSHAFALERYETGPEVPFVPLSFDAEIVACALTDVIGVPHVLDPMVSRSLGHGPQNSFLYQVAEASRPSNQPLSCWFRRTLEDRMWQP